MPKAIWLIGTETGKDEDILNYLNGIEGVNVCKVDGPRYRCNIIAEVSKRNLDDIQNTFEQLEKKEGIASAKNLICTFGFARNENEEIKDYVV